MYITAFFSNWEPKRNQRFAAGSIESQIFYPDREAPGTYQLYYRPPMIVRPLTEAKLSYELRRTPQGQMLVAQGVFASHTKL